MATVALSPDVKENKCTNFYKVFRSIEALKRGICPFIQNEVDNLHTSLKLKIHGVQTTLPEPCTFCNFSFVCWNEVTKDWDLPVRGQCKSTCVLWFHELLECHVNQKSKKIYWENCDIPQWPLKPWECAKVFMPKGQISSSAGPANCTPKALLLLLMNCKYVRRKLSPKGHGLLPKIYATVKMVMNLNEQLPDRDTEIIMQQIIQLLEDPISLKTRVECQAEVAFIRKVSKGDFLVPSPDDLSVWLKRRPLKAVNASELTFEGNNTNNECGDNQMIGAVNATNLYSRNLKQSQDLSGCKEGIAGHDPFPTAKKIKLGIPHNPRCGQIIKWPVEEMEKRIGEEIGKGAFGIVYKAILRPEDSKMLDGNEREFVIKKIKVNEEEFQKSYEKEICYGRILHPFINPIITRAESLPDQSKQRFSYLMFPYMKNKDLRSNIDKENDGCKLSKEEPNYRIWTRCTYQIAQAVDYLHRDLTPVRGSIFHRDLTSNNILLDEHFNIRIGDFGIAVEAKFNATKVTLTSTIGTKGYHPPVMNEKYVASYDIFSVGVVILEMLTGQKPEKDEESKYLYQRFSNEKELDHHLTKRARNNTVSQWGTPEALEHRKQIAAIALAAVSLGGTDRKAVNLLQELEKLRLCLRDRYQSPEPKDLDACVSCYVNRTVKLPLKGKDCLGNEKKDPCQPFCLHCVMNHHINPLVCPKHGKSRPPFGDNVYGVFVAGNQTDGMVKFAFGNQEHKNAADIFIADVEKFVEALTAKHFFESGSRKDHFRIVKPECPGSKEKMMTHIEQAFTDVKSIIERALEENNIEPENRLPSSLFIFYFSGHCSGQNGQNGENGLYLGCAEAKEIISTSTPWIMDMLHVKLRVEQVLVILDCCEANSQDFVHSENPAHKNQNVRIVQLSSCDTNENAQAHLQSEGSTYTHFFCQGLQASRNTIELCAICREENTKNGDISVPCTWYHTECSKDQTVTLKRLIQYIKEHFNLLRDRKHRPVAMTPIQNAKGEVEIYLGYYNPSQPHIPINLSGSQGKNHFQLRKPYPEKMDLIKKDIIKYIVKEDVPCDVLSFHQSYSQNSDDTSCLVGIYPKYGSKKNMELISLDSIYMSWASGLELEARVRENMKELSNGHVKMNKITKSMFSSLEGIDKSSLKVSSDVIQIFLKNTDEAEKQIEESFQTHFDLLDSIKEVLMTCDNLSWELKQEKVLRLFLYEQFAVLKLE